jgi:multidrug efflux pump subunit AcrA (membrane-fusion protein)
MNYINKTREFLFKKWKLIIFLLILMVIGLYFVLASNSSKTASVRYTSFAVSLGSLVQTVSLSGSVAITKQKNYNFKSSGVLSTLSVKAGDLVKSGQELAKLDVQVLQNNLNQSNSSLQQAQNNFENRFKNSPTEYETANLQLAINNAQSKVDLDRYNLNLLTLKSPISGKISKINVLVGDNTTSGSQNPFMIITDKEGLNPRNISFTNSGKLVEIYKNVGDLIDQDMPLAKLDDTQSKTTLQQSIAALEQAKNNFNNRLKSVTNNFDSNNLELGIVTARGKVEIDTVNLDNATLKSDIDGLVTSVGANIGDTVSGSGVSSLNSSSSTSNSSANGNSTSSNSSLVTVVDMSTLVASFNVGESEIPKLKLGQIVQLSFDSMEGKSFTGKISSLDTIGTVSSNVVSYGVKVAFDKLSQDIRPSMSVNANVIISTKDNVLLVPSTAIKTVGGLKNVQIFDTLTNQVKETKEVKIGSSNDTQTEIISGLSEGDVVVTSTINSTISTTSANPFSIFTGGSNNRQNQAGTTNSNPAVTGQTNRSQTNIANPTTQR